MNKVSGQHALIERSGSVGTTALKRLPAYSLSDLLIPISSAIDLAEGRTAGHAQRVAYIAACMAEAVGLEAQARLACCYAALLHDVGVVSAGAGLASYTRGDERLVFAPAPLLTPEEAALGASDSPEVVAERIVDHVLHGVRAVEVLGLPAEAVEGIAAHHEHWDGSGYPHQLVGDEIPVVGRIVALADQVEALIDETTPLVARRNLGHWLASIGGKEGDPELVETLRVLSVGDGFWLGLFGDSTRAEMASRCARLREPRSIQLEPFLETFSQLVDSRFAFTAGVSKKVARLAEALGRAVGLPDFRLKQLRVAALLHDVGQLAVTERIMAKPDILSVEELEVLRQHPSHSHDVVAGMGGLEEVAEWVASHHERLDGRGYPEGRTGGEIPLEARILAVVDAYVAITSDRPHRRRMGPQDAQRQLRGAAGSQLDPELVDAFLRAVVA